MPRSIRLPVLSVGLLTLLSACSSPPPPPAEPPQSAPSPQATELRDTIQRPLDRAKSVEGIIMKSKDKQDQQLQSEEGGDTSPASQ